MLITSNKSYQSNLLQKLNKIKFNNDVFNTLLMNGPAITTSAIVPLQFGNPKGKHQVTIVTHPLCKYCTEVHVKLFKLLQYKTNLLVNEIILTGKSDKSKANRIGTFMLSLKKSNGADTIETALSEYYTEYKDDFEKWIRKYELESSSDIETKVELAKHREWCLENGINETPKIFLNNHALPEHYSIEDLEYLLE
jgi:protein-disulfide isomerase